VCLGDPLDDCEPEARSVVRCRVPRLEDALSLVGVDPRPVVRDIKSVVVTADEDPERRLPIGLLRLRRIRTGLPVSVVPVGLRIGGERSRRDSVGGSRRVRTV